ncbi:MAG: nicotinate-nucleotide--dimethylbenzimidazole phosphoribosyltransferase [Peptococcaceae bacterium]|nr:nicotinate-nucleotide--dimethylbenzimidazole phosphoribosyltransferase [Peptococcaceae bacterium]
MIREQELSAYLNGIEPTDKKAQAQAKNRLDQLVKPLGSLGVLEELAAKLAGIFGSPDYELSRKINVIFCADNGVFDEGYNKYPQSISRLVAEIMAAGRGGGSAIAGALGIPVKIVDLGLKGSYGAGEAIRRSSHRGPGPCRTEILHQKLCPEGTGNITQGPAMDRKQALEAIGAGIGEAEELIGQGFSVLAAGEIGLGNTSTAAAVLAALTGHDSLFLTGMGSGSVGEAYQRKVEAVSRALERNRPDPDDVLDVLAKVGGLDICAMTGFYLACARRRRPAVLDGYISFAAALCAQRLNPLVSGYLISSHLSEEKGALLAAEALEVKPPLHMAMRLGEGTGACLLFPIMDCAAALLKEMASFQDLGCWFPNDWPPAGQDDSH